MLLLHRENIVVSSSAERTVGVSSIVGGAVDVFSLLGRAVADSYLAGRTVDVSSIVGEAVDVFSLSGRAVANSQLAGRSGNVSPYAGKAVGVSHLEEIAHHALHFSERAVGVSAL